MVIRKVHLIRLFCCIFFFAVVSCAGAYTHRVLVLNAYHEGYHWTDRTMEGIKKVMSGAEDVELFVNYMDTKRCSDEIYYEQLKKLYQHKYGQTTFDAIISCDDHALDFLLKYRDELFPEVPVLFCGINDFHPERIAGHQGYTGICETYDIPGTVDMMLDLHPETKELYVITDGSLTGRYFLNLVERAEEQFPDLQFEYLTELDIPVLEGMLQGLPENSLVLWAIYMRMPDGRFISCEESLKLVVGHSVRPVYCIWDVVGKGVVGGKVTSPNYQGEAVAQLALDVISGTPVEGLSVTESPLVYLFDYGVMKGIGLSRDQLPEGSILMNCPYSPYEEYKGIIWLVFSFFFILVIVIVVLVRDINKRKKAEQALLDREEQLRQSEKMSALGQLAGGIAHDFNNQLSGVVGYADLLIEELEDEELKSFAAGIKKSALHSADLTSQLLAFSRRGKYLSVPVNVHEIIHEVVNMLRRSIDKRIKLILQLNAEQSVIQGDPTQLQNAILNMALNSRDAMPDGGEISLQTEIVHLDRGGISGQRRGGGRGQFLELVIKDTGEGMSPEIMSHVFEPFFTTKDPGKGTGMGLAGVYGTVKNHQGVIDVSSVEREGTTIRILLPISESEEIQSDPLSDTAGIPGKVSGKILLVDDEANIRDVGRDMLQSLGYEVTVCENGRDAVDWYKAHFDQVDLVILDMIMPEMDGKETFEMLKVIKSDVRVILSSGYSLEGELQSLMKSGIKALLDKPYGKAELAESVSLVLRGKRVNKMG